MFCTTDELFDVCVDHLTSKQSKSHFNQILLRFTKSIKLWIEFHPTEWTEEREQKLNKILNDFIAPTNQGAAKMITNTLTICKQKLNGETIQKNPFRISSDKISVDVLEPIEIAQFLTAMVVSIYKKIRPTELLKKNWMKKDKRQLSPHIMMLSDNFNRVITLYIYFFDGN